MRRYFKPCIQYHTPCLANLQYDTLVICHTIQYHFHQLYLGSDEGSVSTSEGSDSSCEAMEGPHGDDDGLVIPDSFTSEDL